MPAGILPIVTTRTAIGPRTIRTGGNVFQSVDRRRECRRPTRISGAEVFGNVSPFDPQLFSRINDLRCRAGGECDAVLAIEVAQWTKTTPRATKSLAQVKGQSAEYRRYGRRYNISGLTILWREFRSGVLYRIYQKRKIDGPSTSRSRSIGKHRGGRVGDVAKGVLRVRVTVGEHPQLRGHWLDRLPASIGTSTDGERPRARESGRV